MAALACSDESTGRLTEVDSVTDLAGRWEATRAVFTVIADPRQTADMIQQGGSLVFVIEEDGSFRQEAIFPGDPELEVDSGVIQMSEDTLVFDYSGERVSYTYTLSGEILSLATDLEVERGDFGFTSDEFEIPAHLDMTLRRD